MQSDVKTVRDRAQLTTIFRLICGKFAFEFEGNVSVVRWVWLAVITSGLNFSVEVLFRAWMTVGLLKLSVASCAKLARRCVKSA